MKNAPAPSQARAARGHLAYHSGLAAEDQVASRYLASDHTLVERRWRGAAGEIDLVLKRGNEVIFVEVKKARRLTDAAFRLSDRQLGRIFAAGEEFLASQPDGLTTPSRVDLALVGGEGEIEVIENVMPY